MVNLTYWKILYLRTVCSALDCVILPCSAPYDPLGVIPTII